MYELAPPLSRDDNVAVSLHSPDRGEDVGVVGVRLVQEGLKRRQERPKSVPIPSATQEADKKTKGLRFRFRSREASG